MTLEDDLADIIDRIKEGRFGNEAAVSLGIVVRLLSGMSWPTHDPTVVSPEHPLGGDRVDFALCHPPGRPIVLIEVKRDDEGSGADRQLFRYAVHHGVPLAVLTTGRLWHFFLPGERGNYDERRVYKLDLLERDPAEGAARLRRYLAYQDVCSGAAVEAARADYRDIAKGQQIRGTLPEAWAKLVEEGDELLVELVADKVESLCGYKPDPDTVATFLAEIIRSSPPPPPPFGQTFRTGEPHQRAPVRPTATTGVARALQTSRFDQPAHAVHARDRYIAALRQLADRRPDFLERFAARAGTARRRYVARSREELYPGSPHLAEFSTHSYELRPGWWVDVNLSQQRMQRLLEIAREVAELNDLDADLG